MPDSKTLLECADQLVESQTKAVLSQIQRLVLTEALTVSTKTKTYDQIAADAGYSSGYIKVMASELWKLLSKAIGKKVTKGNVRTMLERQIGTEPLEALPSAESLAVENAMGASPEQLTSTAVEAPEESKESEDDRAGKASILVVDDQPHNVALLTDIMEQDDYEVWQATNGAEALQMAMKLLPDLILLDVNMPDMDGYTVCQQLKADPHTAAIPIIFVSALNESWDKVKGFSVGGDDYITKPFNTLEVIVRIENQLKICQIQGQMSELAAQAQAIAAPESTQASHKNVILMVDDEPKNLALLTNLLENDEYEVWQADCGSEALRIAGMVLPDLILLDINMPDISGYDVCQQLKADAKTKHIPVIFVSAIDETWDKVKAFAVGGNDYVAKPIQLVELMARIQHQLQIWRFYNAASLPA